MDRRGITTSNFLKNAAFPALIAAGLILAAFFVFQAVRGSGGVPAATAPADTPTPQPQDTPAPATPTLPAAPTEPSATPWPPDFTPSPTITPTATSEGVPYVITDPLNRISLTVFPGWYSRTPSAVAVAGVTRLANYDVYHVDPRPPGGLDIQISAGPLDPGQTFEQWVTEWRAHITSPEFNPYNVTLTEPQPYTLGTYQGVSFIGTGDSGVGTLEIDLHHEGWVVVIGLSPADSPVLPEALAMLATLTILPETGP